MGFKKHNILWILSPFNKPYDSISHIILGYLCGYFNWLLYVLIIYQYLNYLYGSEKYQSSHRLRSIIEYILGFFLYLIAKKFNFKLDKLSMF